MPYPDNYRASDNPHLHTVADLAAATRRDAWAELTDTLRGLIDAAHDVRADRLPDVDTTIALHKRAADLLAAVEAER